VVIDPNVFIQETKVATCDIQPGRRPRGPQLLSYLADYRRRAEITATTNTQLKTAQPTHRVSGPPSTEASS
jgi:formate dehydrogenase major subunit